MELLEKKDLTLLVNIAFALCLKGKVFEGREILKLLKDAYPTLKAAKVGIAFSNITVNEFDKAREILDECLKEDPADQDVLALKAFSYALEKNEDEVREIGKSISEDHPSAFKLYQDALEILNKEAS